MVIFKAMHAVLPMFLFMKVVNYSLLSPHIDLKRPIRSTVMIIPHQIAAILISLFKKDYYVRNIGITESLVIETSCHPSVQGFIARISR